MGESLTDDDDDDNVSQPFYHKTGYHDRSDPLYYSEKKRALKESTSNIYGPKGMTTMLASAINLKDLFKSPPIRLNYESEAFVLMTSLYSHLQSNGVYVPYVKEVERDHPMGKAWDPMIATHARKDSLSATLYILLEKL